MACVGAEAVASGAATVAALQARVAELEGEVQRAAAAARAASSSTVASMFQMPTKEDVLAGAVLGSSKNSLKCPRTCTTYLAHSRRLHADHSFI